MSLSLRDCFKILQVGSNPTLEEIKSNYRKLAFKLHPDLNPDDPEASAQFQNLNEAYVIAKEYLETSSQEAYSRKGKKAKTRSTERKRKTKTDSDRTKQQDKAAPGDSTSSGMGATFEFKQEEVLQDILNDPFARKVFEDIYAQLKTDRSGPSGSSSSFNSQQPTNSGNIENGASRSASPQPKNATKRKLEMNWGEKSFKWDMKKGVVGSVKSWMKGQLDAHQTARFPASSLLPGRTVRLKIQQAGDEEKFVDVKLPADFVIGRPIRLRGLGGKIGPFTGDLYLRLFPK